MVSSGEKEVKALHVPLSYGDLPEGWAWKRLDDVCNGIFDCPHSTPKLIETGPYVVRTQDIITGVFRADLAGQVSEETYSERTSRAVPRRGDLLYSREGTYFGIAAEVPPNTRVCLGQRMVLIRPANGVINFSYLRYWLNSTIMATHIHGYRDGSVAERLNLPTIRGLPVLLPPLPEQKRIAHILGTLDEKIELNRKINQTLEAMAQALFKSWFVDFDPVHSKMDGRQPYGINAETAKLFPDRLVESELGMIPEGWEVKDVGEIIDCVGGGTPSTKEPKYWEEGVHHWATPKDLSSLSSPVLIETSRKLTDAGIAKVLSGLLPPGTLLLSSRAPVGYLAISQIPVAINQGFIAMKCNEKATSNFMLNWCRENMGEIEGRASGTTFAEISKKNYRSIPMILPPVELVDWFTNSVAPMYQEIASNLIQSRTLANLRDNLLPKLLSGELSVAQAKEMAS